MYVPKSVKNEGASGSAPKSEQILPPTPAIVYMLIEVHKEVKEGRMVEIQWKQQYSYREWAPVFKVDPELLKEKQPWRAIVVVYEEPRKWLMRNEKPAPEGSKRTVIKIYKPDKSNFKRPAIAVIAEFPLRETKMGGRDDVEFNEDGVLFWDFAVNLSKSGRHGKIMYVVISKKPVRFVVVSISNRGNREERIIEYGLKGVRTLSLYEVIKSEYLNGYAKLVRIRDNLRNEEFDGLELLYHESYKTAAKTEHKIEPEDAVEAVYSTYSSSKTHWTVLYRILKKPLKLVTIRISNRGNETKFEHLIQ